MILGEKLWKNPGETMAKLRATLCPNARENHKEDKNTGRSKCGEKDETNRKNQLAQLFELYFNQDAKAE